VTEIQYRETASQTCPHCDQGLFAPDYEWQKHHSGRINDSFSGFDCPYCGAFIGITRTVVAYYEFDVFAIPEEKKS